MENQIISINLIPNLSTPAVVRVSQYDVGRPLVFKVYDGTSPADLTGVTAVIEGTKKSGLGFSESGTVADNTVTLDTTLAMTQEDGSIPAEIRFSKTGEDVGTANFILAVEKSPHLEGTTDGTTETMADLQSQLDALDERVEALEGGGGGLTEAVKSAMLQIAQKVAYIDEHGQTYYDALYNALYPPASLVSISAVYTQSGTVYDTDTLDNLRSDLVVTAYYDNQTSAVVTNYTLSGTLTVGTSTITVSYGGKITTFNVTVSEVAPLYQLAEVAETSLMNVKASLQDVDTLVVNKTAGNGSILCFNNDGTITLTSVSGATWFSLSAGDAWTMKLTNISYNNATAGNKFNVTLRNDSSSEIIRSGDINIASTGEGTLSDVEVSGTVSSATGNLTLSAYIHRAMQITFRVEFYVNGVLYV